MSKTRIIETVDGRWMPQFKPGLLSGWKFLDPRADESPSMLVWMLKMDDPAKAASFGTEEEARAFMDRFILNVTAHWNNRYAAKQREREGVQIKQVRQ